MLKFGTPTIALPLAIKNVLFRLDALYMYIAMWTKKYFESYFSDRLTFSNIRGRTSRRIYRLALPLLSFLQKPFPRQVNQGFSYIMRTLLYLFWMDDTIT